jgi:phosphoribosylformylglycinamidine synthase subunit PurQ / glutaminase
MLASEDIDMNPKALIITGYGLNCERETAWALRRAGAEVDQIHLGDLLGQTDPLAGYGLLAFIGGFSFGDHLGAGRALAVRMRHTLAEPLARFTGEGGLALGICNGFQVLVKLGLLPGFEPFSTATEQQVTLTHNDSGVFRDDWVRLRVDAGTKCVFTRGLDRLELPIRHGEGKFVAASPEVLARLQAGGQVVYRYCDAAGEPTQDFPDNPNGSVDAIAGICDATGRIFGTMPHPEAAILPEHHPDFPRRRALGQALPEPLAMRIFENAVEAMGQPVG